MPLPEHILSRLFPSLEGVEGNTAKRGEEIFAGTDYPRDWNAFIGQERAKEQLRVMIASAKARHTRIDHTLFASGYAGVGKTTLATLLAYHAGVGLIQTTGPLTLAEFRRLVDGMRDNDILFIDEIHTLVQGSRNRADWLLPFMTEGVLYTERGAVEVPDIAIVGATTDVGRLPETIVSRFMAQPTILPYTQIEGALIAGQLATRMGVAVEDVRELEAISRAADANPRVMRQILTAVRDLGFAYPETHPNLAKAYEWVGVAEDGLSLVARSILAVLLAAPDHTASIESIRAQLNEPGPLRYAEQALLQRGLVAITGRGRKLTDYGIARARQELA